MKPDLVIFTDGSLRRWNEKSRRPDIAASFGVVVLNVHTQKYTSFGNEVNTNSSIMAESMAYYRGLQYAVRLKKKHKICNILIVTDSKISVDIFHEFIPKVWDISGKVWKKQDGKPVKMQSIYQKILSIINDNGLNVRFVHITSHNRKSEWKNVKKKLEDNGIRVSDDIAKLFIRMNDLADKVATDITSRVRMESSIKSYQRLNRQLAWKLESAEQIRKEGARIGSQSTGIYG